MAKEKEKSKKKFSFLTDFEKDLEKMDGVSTTDDPPRYWYSAGNLVLNRIISGAFNKGIPQGRITDLAGPSGAGKSFFAANFIAAAQREGSFCLVIDSENALTADFVTKIGVDPRKDYQYVKATTIPHVSRIVSLFLKNYKDECGDDPNAPPVLIVIDSLDMLMTETEVEHFDKGVTKGDQGQKNKQLKAMLRTFVHAIEHLNVAMVVTSQVYKNQDVLNGEGLWIVSDAVKYACSQIILIQKRKLKDESKGAKAGDVAGVRMICEGYKTRFTKPFQKVEIEVPYETGMDPYSGFLEVAKKVGIIEQKGSRYCIAGEEDTWYGKDIEQYAERIMAKMDAMDSVFLDADGEIDTSEGSEEGSSKQRRKARFDELQAQGESIEG